MRAYLFTFYNGSDRIIVHPRGLPPGWTESGLTPEREAEVIAEVERRSQNYAHFGIRRPPCVEHLNPENLEPIETFLLR